jgi:DNA-binding beta-propeller fold protein YncE
MSVAQPNVAQSVAADSTSLPPAAGSNLYVANNLGDNISVYAKGSNSVLRTISQHMHGPRALAFDQSGNLFVSNGNKVTVYAAGKAKVLRVINDDVRTPGALAFDGSGNLYVANFYHNTVTVYPPGANRYCERSRRVWSGRVI